MRYHLYEEPDDDFNAAEPDFDSSVKKKNKTDDSSFIEKLIAEIMSEEGASSPKDERDISTVLVKDALLPMEFWAKGWVLRNVDDLVWREMTRDQEPPFPRTLRKNKKCHPAYVLKEIGNYGLKICPCSTCLQKGRYIPKGGELEPTKVRNQYDSYLVESASVTLSRSRYVEKLPRFLGIFPEEKLQEKK